MMDTSHEALIEAVREARISDPRTAVFDVTVEPLDDGVRIVGETTEPDAVAELAARLGERLAGAEVVDEVVRLPDPALPEGERYALVRSAVAPVHARPAVAASQVSQYVLGHRLTLLSRRDRWWRVQGEDGYIGWVHHGYLAPGDAAWARAWERGVGSERVVALGAELVDEEERTFARLPWGARLFRDTPNRYRLPDGRRGALGAGEIIAVDRLTDRFPPRGESIARTARRWIGTPYLWGGVTPAGADCSGYVQAVFWMHGIALPRDSDQQARIGVEVEPGGGFEALRSGDLLFFAEEQGRITHVAISLGGPHIVHASLSNGSVDVNDLTGERSVEAELGEIFVQARRVLPD